MHQMRISATQVSFKVMLRSKKLEIRKIKVKTVKDPLSGVFLGNIFPLYSASVENITVFLISLYSQFENFP
jgi:hypothetical protein